MILTVFYLANDFIIVHDNSSFRCTVLLFPGYKIIFLNLKYSCDRGDKMAIFAISDLHLPLSVDKPMDVFGERWRNYVERMQSNWQKIVGADDIVIMPGDISWATYLDDSVADFEYINNLNGTKVILKGNHDYWWTTMNKLNNFLERKDFNTIKFIHNNAFMYGRTAICGTRGWNIAVENSSEEDKRIFLREKQRLILSLEDAKRNNSEEIIVAMHYPPVEIGGQNLEFIDIMKEYGVKKCIYGHLHAAAQKFARQGDVNGVNLSLVSCDFLNFIPKLV